MYWGVGTLSPPADGATIKVTTAHYLTPRHQTRDRSLEENLRFLVVATIALLMLGTARAAQPKQGLENRILTGLESAVYISGEKRDLMTLSSRMKYYRVPAVSMAVIDGYRVAWTYATGMRDVRSKERVSTATLFQAASMSKPVAAAAILRLFQQKGLSLDADVNTMLRTWQVPPSPYTANQHVTMRRLLSHTAGINVHGFAGYDRDDPVPNTVQVLNGVAPANNEPIRVISVPGSVTEYSGGGTTIAQQVAADVSGSPFAAFMQSTLLQPLHMRNSTFEQPLPKSLWRTAAAGYDVNGTAVHRGWHVYPTMAAAGLWTTPTDLALFVIAIQNALRGAGTPPIDATVAREMTTKASQGFGLGPELQTGYFSHNGANEGYRGIFIGLLRDGKGVVVMTNSDNGLQLSDEIVHSVAKAYGWPVLRPTPRSAIRLSLAHMRKFAGTYVAEVGGDRVTLNVTLDRRLSPSLVLRTALNGNFPQQLYAETPRRLFTLSGASFEASPGNENVRWLRYAQIKFVRKS